MKNAIIILIHQLPEQVNIFLEQILKSTNMDIYIHINKRFDSIRTKLKKNDRINISDHNIEITWGSDDIIKAIMIMLTEVVKSNIEYGHVLLNTGQDLLIKKGLDNYLEQNPREIFFEAYEQDKKRRAFLLHTWPDKYRQLMDNKFNPWKILRRLRLELFTRGIPIFEKKVSCDIKGIVFYRNWFWGAMPLEVVRYVLDFVNDNPSFMEIYKNALVPEEGFMVTLIMRSPYKGWIHFDETGHSKSLTNILNRSNGHPDVITYNDIEELNKSQFFFSRKFDIRTDRKIVEYYFEKICN